ncbi:MAG TPA: hypothetical protein VGL53_04295 [Bryobacteraceae bacterium]|jgi:hypothetical protein
MPLTRSLLAAAFGAALPLCAQFISADTYTRYELLAPSSHQFRIIYEVTETAPLAKFHFNQIRPGSEASDEAVYDAATGQPLKFEVVTGTQAKKDAPDQNLIADAHYIEVHLAHPVPAQGEYRLRIEKTYMDPKSYYAEGSQDIVFMRPLGIPRDSVVLPAGYELVQTSMAAQVLAEPDGRLRLGFMNPGSGGQLEVKIIARPLPSSKASAAKMPRERAYQDREILYELLDPSTSAFRITHDYTESRPGRAHYINIVRTGSHVSDPASIDLDSGQPLKFEVMTAKEGKARKIPVFENPVDADDNSEIVVTFLDKPVAPGTSVRLRLMETYTDPKSYFMDGDELVWTRTFGRPRNTVVLPKGWTITAMDTPAIVRTLPDGRVSVYTVNPRNDEVKVWFRARKRAIQEAKP